ncbi:hypothetical protein ACFB49_31500 [Sphingomonas sp. DBB INV C78]|uniref:hypothetical protein n=1 Tax=Sphingomonas sp. DBB INV C78 TaxID=3349434 RepID=UPI0036D37E8C
MRGAMIAIGAASLALLPQPLLAQAATPAKPAIKPADRDAFCFVATALSSSALRQNEAKLSEQDKKAIPQLTQAIPYYAGRTTKRLSGSALVAALKVAEGEFKTSNRGVETATCMNAFGSDMKTIIAASQQAGQASAPAKK